MSVHSTPGGRWQVKWPEGGRRRAVTVDTSQAAELLDLQIKDAKRKGLPMPTLPSAPRLANSASTPPSPTAITLCDYMVHDLGGTASFFDRQMKSLAPSTLKQESRYWDIHIAPYFRDVTLDQITVVMLEDFRDELLANGVGLASVERVQKIVAKVLNDAARRGVIPFNPAGAVKQAKAVRKPIKAFEPSEVERLAAVLSGKDRLLVQLLAYAGVRPGEAIGTGNSTGIRWSSLHTDDHGQMTMTVHGGKTASFRTVRVSPTLQAILEAWREERAPGEDELIVPAGVGAGPWTVTQYRNWRKRVWHPACERAEVGRRRPYDLRHGYASLLLRAGEGLPEVASQLGNSVQICAQRYAHVLEGMRHLPSLSHEEAIRAARLDQR